MSPVDSINGVNSDLELNKISFEDLYAPEELDAMTQEERELRKKVTPSALGMLQQLQTAPTDFPMNKSVQGIVSSVLPVLQKTAEKIKDISEKQGIAPSSSLIKEALKEAAQELNFPNLAYEVLNKGFELETHHSEKLEEYKNEISKRRETMGLLLGLKKHLQKLTEDDAKSTLPEEAKKILQDLKNRGVELLVKKDNLDTLTSHELRELKSMIDSTRDDIQSEIQSIITTDVAKSIQYMNAFIDVMKKVAELDDRVKRKAINPHG